MFISKDSRTQEILRKAAKFLQSIKDEDDRKRSEVERVFHRRFAFLPTKLSSGNFIFFRYYNARYNARHVNYVEVFRDTVVVTDVYKHYIDKDFEPDYTSPIEKVL